MDSTIQNIYTPSYFIDGKSSLDMGDDSIYFSYAREALSHLLDQFAKKNSRAAKVLVPSFICTDVILQLEKAKTSYMYYEVNADLEVQIDSLPTESAYDFFVAVNYFGKKTNFLEIKAYCSKQSIEIIEDNAQSFLGIAPEDSFGDYVFYSFRKTLPVSCGAALIWKSTSLLSKSLLKTRKENSEELALNLTKLSIRKLLKYIPLKFLLIMLSMKRYILQNKQSSSLGDNELDLESYRSILVPNFSEENHARIKQKLHRTLKEYLVSNFDKLQFISYIEGAIPTCLPMIIDQSQVHEVRRTLKKVNCDLVKWPDFYDESEIDEKSFYNNFYFVPFVW